MIGFVISRCRTLGRGLNSWRITAKATIFALDNITHRRVGYEPSPSLARTTLQKSPYAGDINSDSIEKDQ